MAHPRRFALFLVIGLLLVAGSTVYAQSKSTLIWENGDQLPGRLVGASESHIRWQSDAFETPFDIDLRVLKSIRFPETKSRNAKLPPLRFLIRTGEVLYGSLLEIDDKHVVIDAPRHGRVAVRRSAVRSFDLVNSSAWTNVGPGSHQTWKTLRRGRSLNDWKSDGNGHLTTTIIGAELYGDLQLPEMSEIDIKLGFEKKPGFLITFLKPGGRAPSRGTVKLETWEDELVLQTLAANGGFKPVLTLEEGTRFIQLRLIWDRDAGELSVFSQQGQLLGKMEAGADSGKGHSGLYIKNKGSQLSLMHVQSSRSGGKPAQLPRGSKSYVRLVDGSIAVGSIRGFDAASSEIIVATDGQQRRIGLDKMSRAVLDDRMVKLPGDGVRIAFADGSMVFGNLAGVEGGKLRIKTLYADEPVPTSLTAARELRFLSSHPFKPSREEALAGAHMMQLPSGPLHGGLASAGEDDNQLGWRPFGSRNASPLPAATSSRIQLDTEQATAAFADLPPIDVIFLRNGDIVPCKIEGVDDETVYFTTELSDANQLPHTRVKAVELATRAFLPISGFGDSRWNFNVPGENYEFNDEQIIFKGPGSMRHEHILQGDEIRFDMHWNNNAPALTFVNLFTDGEKKASNRQLLIYFMQQQLFVRGIRNQFHQVNRQGRRQVADAKVSFRILLTEKKLRVYADDDLILDQPFLDKMKEGNGLAFDVQRINVARNRRGRAEKADGERLLTISNFQIRRSSGPFGVRALDPDSRNHLLTVPRNRKQNPDTHVVIGVNGDLLRGRLEAIRGDQIELVSRLDDIALPRDRVAGIVWLTEPETEAEPLPSGQATVQAVLITGTTLLFDAHKIRGNVLFGQHGLLGACQVPLNMVHELRMGTATRPEACVYADWKLQPALEPQFAPTAADGGADGVEPFGGNSPLVGVTPPATRINLLDDSQFNLKANRGKVVVLDFWAVWCVPCVRAMPHLIEAVAEFPEDQVAFVAVNQQDNPNQVREFLDKRGWDLRVGLDPDGKLGERFGVEAIPQTVIIGPDGKIAHVHVGAHPQLKDAIHDAIAELLNE